MDNRKKYKNKKWQQGYLLCTIITREWDKERLKEGDYKEKCCAFVNFEIRYEGRSREFVYKYETPDKCKKAIQKHNKKLTKPTNVDIKKI